MMWEKKGLAHERVSSLSALTGYGRPRMIGVIAAAALKSRNTPVEGVSDAILQIQWRIHWPIHWPIQ